MRLVYLEVAPEEDNQKLLIGPLTKLHTINNFSIFQLM